MKRILVVAGEASADLHAANLITAIKKHAGPEIEFSGLGGERLVKTGLFTLEYDNSLFAVTGFFEIFGRFRLIYSALRHFRNMASLGSYDLAILLDYPDFNMSLARYLRKIAVPVVYYISPQVWVWRQGRAKKLGRYCHKILSIFPFEKDFYKAHGVENVSYVGHPLLDEIEKYLRQEHSKELIDEKRRSKAKLVAVLPGSRHNEIKHIMPVMMDACKILKQKYGDGIRFVLPLAPTLKREDIEHHIPDDLPMAVVSGKTYDVYSASDYAIVASGTATVECALFNLPMTIVYRVTGMSAWLYKKIVRYKGPIGMVNLLAGKIICNEFFQDRATPDLIAADVENNLFNEDNYANIKNELNNIKNVLDTGQSPTENAAKEIVRLI
jgi:lipid-A-disaccharide synthase